MQMTPMGIPPVTFGKQCKKQCDCSQPSDLALRAQQLHEKADRLEREAKEESPLVKSMRARNKAATEELRRKLQGPLETLRRIARGERV